MARERSAEPLRSPTRQSGQSLPIADLRHLIALMQNSDIEEITVERDAGALRLHLRKPAPVAGLAAPGELDVFEGVDGVESANHARNASPAEDRLVPVSAPLVGRFHVGPKPGAAPLVVEGDMVRQGQVVGTIETLNLFNEVEAAQAGRVVEVVVVEGQPVEYGQVLMTIEPPTM
jgi:acetyl-CoA carboxylase biotin carboxyl carrier protein